MIFVGFTAMFMERKKNWRNTPILWRVCEQKDTILASEPNRRKIYCPGFQHQDVPILLTEFGGIGYDTGAQGWGYTNAANEAEFIQDYQRVIDAVYQSEILHGFCYTQLTDVEQEKTVC